MLNTHHTDNKGCMNCSANKGLTMLNRHYLTRHTMNKGPNNGSTMRNGHTYEGHKNSYISTNKWVNNAQ